MGKGDALKEKYINKGYNCPWEINQFLFIYESAMALDGVLGRVLSKFRKMKE